MMRQIVRCFAEVVAPVAQGMLEMAQGQALGLVVEKLRDHFQSSQVLPGALEDSFEKGMGTVEIALSGPRFYHKTANKEFAERFRVEVLAPIFEEKGWSTRSRSKGKNTAKSIGRRRSRR